MRDAHGTRTRADRGGDAGEEGRIKQEYKGMAGGWAIFERGGRFISTRLRLLTSALT